MLVYSEYFDDTTMLPYSFGFFRWLLMALWCEATATLDTWIVLNVWTAHCTEFPYSVNTHSKHKVFSTRARNLGHTVRLSIIPSPWASRMSRCHSSVFVGKTDLHGPPNIESPMSAKQLNPEDGQKQNKRTAGLAWVLLRSTISASAWSQHFDSVFTQSYEILYSAELQHCTPN